MVRETFVAALLLAGAYVAIVHTGCAPAPAATKQRSMEAWASYSGDLAACVDDAGTLEQSHACRAAVRQKWHVVDGGVQ